MNYTDRLSNNSLAIFLFHGVVASLEYEVRNYSRKHLESTYFEEIIRSLSNAGSPLSMDDVVIHHTEMKPFPKGSFAITFDDGFENNYSIAAPILTKYSVPGMFYVTTDFIDNNHMSWIDRIELCFEQQKSGRLKLPWSQETKTFSKPEKKISLLDEIRCHVKKDSSLNQDELASLIYEQCGMDEIISSDDPLDLKMSWNQLSELSSMDLFMIGGHTHRHVNLAFLSERALDDEIRISLELLKKKSGVSVNYYSYPEGLENCYSESVIRSLKKYGVICSPTAIDGVNSLENNPDALFHLNRIMVV